MADIKSPESRSKNMKAIRSRDTKPELILRNILYHEGFRYRVDYKCIPGRPDIYVLKYKVAIYVHGCFWHRHTGCRFSTVPKTRQDFWEKKFQANIRRDEVVLQELQEKHIRHCIIWECALKGLKRNPEKKEALVRELIDFIRSDKMFIEIPGK